MSVQFTIAGTGPVDDKNNKKILNYNLSHIVKGHLDNSRKLPEVLPAVGVGVKDLPNTDNCRDIREGIEKARDAFTDNLSMQSFSQGNCSANKSNRIEKVAVRDKLNME